jgi:type IV pilus assembly protein PilB
VGRLGQILVGLGILTPLQLESALNEQRRTSGRLGEVLIRMGLVTEVDITRALASQLNVAAVAPEALAAPPPALLARIPSRLAHALQVLPLEERAEERTLVVAMAEVLKGDRLEQLREHVRCWVVPRLAPPAALGRAIAAAYGPPVPDEEPVTARSILPRGPQLTHPEVRALVRLLLDKGLVSNSEVSAAFKGLAPERPTSSTHAVPNHEGATP